MPRSVASSVENNFINGLVTEATALNFPESACTETYNCVFRLKGSVSRRLGFDYESGYTLFSVTRSTSALNTFFWRNAAGDGNNSFVVLQVGTTLSFFRMGTDAGLSQNKHASTISLSSFAVAGTTSPGSMECQFASGAGFLFVTNPQLDPFVISYSSATDTFTATRITIRVRDFRGVIETGVAVDTKTDVLTNSHHYNLLNQGWPSPSLTTGATVIGYAPIGGGRVWPVFGMTTSTTDYIQDFKTHTGYFPTNADVWWLFKNASDVWDISNLKDTVTRGNSPAPKGKFILDAFYQDRSTQSGLTGIDVVSSGSNRPSAVAFFAGRVWYSGVNAQGYSNKLYFSQIVEANGTTEVGNCYQQNDPTSETLFDLLATDGGDLQILEAGNIIKLMPLQTSLLVFCTNGVWTVTGSVGAGFSPTDYSVRKLGSIPSISPSNFVDVGGVPMWWNTDGIYLLQGNDSLGQVKIDSLTEKKIKTFYNNIPNNAKFNAKGAYDPITRTVKWVYRQASITGTDDKYDYDSVLCFNVNTGAFYPYSVPVSTARINGVLVVDGIGKASSVSQTVTTLAGASVTDSAAHLVTSSTFSTIPVAGSCKFLCSKLTSGTTYNMVFGGELNEDYLDWVAADTVGINFSSYMISGYKVHGDAEKKFQSNYVYLYGDTSQRDCVFFVKSIFDYTSDSSTGRWSTPQKLTFPQTNKHYSFKRVKLRGRGLALQLRINSADGQPFELNGWSIFETGNASI